MLFLRFWQSAFAKNRRCTRGTNGSKSKRETKKRSERQPEWTITSKNLTWSVHYPTERCTFIIWADHSLRDFKGRGWRPAANVAHLPMTSKLPHPALCRGRSDTYLWRTETKACGYADLVRLRGWCLLAARINILIPTGRRRVPISVLALYSQW